MITRENKKKEITTEEERRQSENKWKKVNN